MGTLVLRPIHDRILVKLVDADSVSSGGIHIPGTSDALVRKGTVMAIGPGRPLPDGGFQTMSVGIGDTVYFGKHTGVPFPIPGDDGKYYLMREEDVYAVGWDTERRLQLAGSMVLPDPPAPKEDDIRFSFEQRMYAAPMAFYKRGLVELPDGRVLRANGFKETYPPSPHGLALCSVANHCDTIPKATEVR